MSLHLLSDRLDHGVRPLRSCRRNGPESIHLVPGQGISDGIGNSWQVRCSDQEIVLHTDRVQGADECHDCRRPARARLQALHDSLVVALKVGFCTSWTERLAPTASWTTSGSTSSWSRRRSSKSINSPRQFARGVYQVVQRATDEQPADGPLHERSWS